MLRRETCGAFCIISKKLPEVFRTAFYTKHHLKFGKNQADNLVAVENRFICDFGADFFLYFIGV